MNNWFYLIEQSGQSLQRHIPFARVRILFFSYRKFEGISYKTRKNPAPQDSPPAADRSSGSFPFRRSAIILFSYRKSEGISYKDSGVKRVRRTHSIPYIDVQASLQ